MGTKRNPSSDEYRFVVYDPRKKTCTPADRTLIKRLAGKQGSETKKRRLRQEKASKAASSTQTPAADHDSGTASASDADSRRPSQLGMPQVWPVSLSATPIPGDQDFRLPHPTTDDFWAEVGAPDWQTATSRPTTQTLRSWDDTSTTPSVPFGHSNRATPANSDTCGIGELDYFAMQSEFKEPNFIDHARPYNHVDQPQQRTPRTFGSFDSGFQDSDTFGYDFTRRNDSSGLSPAGHNVLEHVGRLAHVSNTLQHHVKSGQREAAVRVTVANPPPLVHGDADPFESDTPSDSGQQSIFGSRLGPADLPATQRRPSARIERRPSSQCSPKSCGQSSWPNIDNVLVRWVQYKEKQGQLDHGSASACLNALSDCEEARSLWSLNLSRVSTNLVLCSERPNDIYSRAKARLQSMTPGERMDVEGSLIKIGIAEYIAISLAFEMTSLQEHVATRKGLGIWSKAEAIVDYRLAGLISDVRSMSNRLWPDEEELKSLRGPL